MPVQKVWTSGFNNITSAYTDIADLPDGALIAVTIGNNQYNFTKLQLETFIGALAAAGYLAKANNLSDLANAATARTNLGLGTAAESDTGDFATAAQGALADSALQSSDIGVSVQAYDADTTKKDLAQSWSALQTFAAGIVISGGYTLDQVETGSYSPTISASTPGDLSVAYSTQVSTYFIIGDMLFMYAQMVFTPTFTTASGTLQLGLPVTPSALGQLFMNNLDNIPGSATGVYPFFHCLSGNLSAVGREIKNASNYTRGNLTWGFTSGNTYSISVVGNYRI